MRLLIARCTVDYKGRLEAHLPSAVRLIMLKADGCVAVHADGGAYKPLNWMNAPNRLTIDKKVWRVTSQTGRDTLTITLDEVLHDSTHDLGVDPGIRKDGVEAQLQEMLAADPAPLGTGLTIVRREFPTAIGPVDLLCRDSDGGCVAVEVKRFGEIDGVEQLTRYLEFLNRDPSLSPVRGLLAATAIRPQARTLAASRSIDCVLLDYDELRGVDPPQARLF